MLSLMSFQKNWTDLFSIHIPKYVRTYVVYREEKYVQYFLLGFSWFKEIQIRISTSDYYKILIRFTAQYVINSSFWDELSIHLA